MSRRTKITQNICNHVNSRINMLKRNVKEGEKETHFHFNQELLPWQLTSVRSNAINLISHSKTEAQTIIGETNLASVFFFSFNIFNFQRPYNLSYMLMPTKQYSTGLMCGLYVNLESCTNLTVHAKQHYSKPSHASGRASN